MTIMYRQYNLNISRYTASGSVCSFDSVDNWQHLEDSENKFTGPGGRSR